MIYSQPESAKIGGKLRKSESCSGWPIMSPGSRQLSNRLRRFLRDASALRVTVGPPGDLPPASEPQPRFKPVNHHIWEKAMSWTITLEIPVTRRQRMHEIRDESGKTKFQSQRIDQCIEFLIENDIRRVEVISALGHWLIDIDVFPWDAENPPT